MKNSMRPIWRRACIWLLLLTVVCQTVCLTGCGNGETDTDLGGTNAGATPSTPSTGKKQIAFTFDDGPHAPTEDRDEGIYPYTTYILDEVERLRGEGYNVGVTFFVLGSRARSYPGALRRALSLGCEIGSHTYDHDSFRGESQAFIADTLGRASDAIQAAGAPKPYLYRPVGGSVTPDQLSYTASLGYTAVAWSIDTEDWSGNPSTADKYANDPNRRAAYEAFVEQKVQLILAQASDGDIILLHDIYMSSVDIFLRASAELLKQGYELVTVSQLLGLTADSTPATEMYIARGQTISSMG